LRTNSPREYFEGELMMTRVGNHVPTATEVKELSSGASVPYKYKGANQTEKLTDGAFTDTANWTEETGWAVTGGVCVGTSVGVNERCHQSISGLTIGKAYTISAECTAYTDGSVGFYVSDFSTASSGGVGEKSSTGVFSYTFVADATSGNIGLISMTAGSDLTVDNISIVQIGAVAEYDGSSAGAHQWGDKSGNELHGTVGDGAGGATAPTLENTPYDAGTEYEEGTWTPTDASSDGLSFSNAYGKYTRIGNVVCAKLVVVYPTTSGTGTPRIDGLPFNAANDNINDTGTYALPTNSALGTAHGFGIRTNANNDMVEFIKLENGGDADNAHLSGQTVQLQITYWV
jgi:hypothetical protein